MMQAVVAAMKTAAAAGGTRRASSLRTGSGSADLVGVGEEGREVDAARPAA
jgi:hypothetical protein